VGRRGGGERGGRGVGRNWTREEEEEVEWGGLK